MTDTRVVEFFDKYSGVELHWDSPMMWSLGPFIVDRHTIFQIFIEEYGAYPDFLQQLVRRKNDAN